MRAAVLEAYDTPLKIRDVDIPEIGPGDLLVRVRACGVCGTDLKIAGGKIPGIPVPLIPGHEIAGAVDGLPQAGGRPVDARHDSQVRALFYGGGQ